MISTAITELAVGALAGGGFQAVSEAAKLVQGGMLTIRDISVSRNEQARENLLAVTAERNAAAGRSSPKLRFVLAVTCFLSAFILPFVAGLIEMPTSLVQDGKPISVLWGLMSWGGKAVVTEAYGFVMGPEFWSTIRVVTGFVFGVGGVSTGRRYF
jgi:hypothetical protein